MIKFHSEGQDYKSAAAPEPQTAEFEPYRRARADKAKSDLIDETSQAIGTVVDALPDPRNNEIRPDDLYEAVLRKQGLRKRWKEAFESDEIARDLFGLVAWTYFFADKKRTWLAKVGATPGLGNRGWSYMLGFAPPQCVCWAGKQFGRIIAGPFVVEGENKYQVRFKPRLDVPTKFAEKSIVDYNLEPADDNKCRGIDATP